MNILFLHRNFPGQFKHLINELLKDSSNIITFVTENKDIEIEGVRKIVYEIKECEPASKTKNFYEESLIHAKAARGAVIKLKEAGFVPEIIYAHSWGPAMFMKDIYPQVPLICYFEWFYNTKGETFDYFKLGSSTEKIRELDSKNESILLDLQNCDAGVSPTRWQKSQFPKEFQDKITVIPDGVDTRLCTPDINAEFIIEDKKLVLTAENEVITYATRGMELCRGFPNFMKAVEYLQKKRPKAHFVIAGYDQVFYGMKIEGKSYKQILLEQLDIDLTRIHFVGFLPYDKYLKLLQISSVHVYLTAPFVLSWSILEAMACGCCIVASATSPVLEIINDGENGLLFDFFNINQLVEKIEYALDNKSEMVKIRKNARKTILNHYSLEKIMPYYVKFLNDC